MDKDKTSSELLKRRDLSNFVRLRTSHPGDDLAVGDLLARSFRETYARKLPSAVCPPEQENELRDVHSRRLNGVVRVIELGFQIIGTYSLIAPKSDLDESWTSNTCTLRCVALDPHFHSLKLSEQLLKDAVEIAERWKTEGICLHVQSGAEGVANLYMRFGFERSEVGDKVWFGSRIKGYFLKLVPKEKVSNLEQDPIEAERKI